jgi:hypothetical protein
MPREAKKEMEGRQDDNTTRRIMVRSQDDDLECRAHLKKRQDANFSKTRYSVCSSCAFCLPPQRGCWKTHLPVPPPSRPLPFSLPPPSLRPFMLCCATQKREWKKPCYDNPFLNASKEPQPKKKARASSRATRDVVYDLNGASHDAGLFVPTAPTSLDSHLTKHEASLLLVRGGGGGGMGGRGGDAVVTRS